MSLRVAVLLVLCTILYSVDAAKNRAGDDSYEDHYRVSAFYDPNFKPEPFLSASESITHRNGRARRVKPHNVMRGYSRHKLANKKLYSDPNRPTIDRLLGSYIFDIDEDGDSDPPTRSTLPWIQLATLGTVVMGLNVVFTQLMLGMTKAPNLPIPFINPSGRSFPSFSWDFRSLDLFEDKMAKSSLSKENYCTPRRICEFRQLLTFVPYVDNLINTYGMRVPSLRHEYQRALDTGSKGLSCSLADDHSHQRNEVTGNCASVPMELVLGFVKYLNSE